MVWTIGNTLPQELIAPTPLMSLWPDFSNAGGTLIVLHDKYQAVRCAMLNLNSILMQAAMLMFDGDSEAPCKTRQVF